MNSSPLLSRKGVIYALLIVGTGTLAILNFWGWFLVRGIEKQVLAQFTHQLQSTSSLYALQIGNDFFLDNSFGEVSGNQLNLVRLERLLFDFKERGDLEDIFLVSPDRQTIVDYNFASGTTQRDHQFLISDSLFLKARNGAAPSTELREFSGQIFLTAYTPVKDISDEVAAVLILDAPARFSAQLSGLRVFILYLGIGGITVLAVFATIILMAIRQLFRVEETLHQQNRLAQLGQMAAMVAHEIRNPLSIIKGSADVLRKKYAAEENELFDYIPEEIDRLNRLVNDFLQFARQPNVKIAPMSVNPAIERLVAEINDPRIRCELSASTGTARLSPDAFKQVLLNIIENARKAVSDDGEIRVISMRPGGRPVRVRIEVRDNGSGMSETTLKKIFDPFFSTRATGSGLGMAITRQLVEQMQGQISVESAVGKGTTVKMEFPG